MSRWRRSLSYDQLHTKHHYSVCCAEINRLTFQARFALNENGPILTVQYSSVKEAQKDLEEVLSQYWELDEDE